MLSDLRMIFATILTDPGSSLAYGADALIAVTVGLFYSSYTLGVGVTLGGALFIMSVYLISIIVYNQMVDHHADPVFGGGAFVSAMLTSRKIFHPRLKRTVRSMGKIGNAALLADFPTTQAISMISGVEAMYFIPLEQRLMVAIGLVVLLSMIQKFGLGNLGKIMIWPILAFYAINFLINLTGLATVLMNGPQAPILPQSLDHFKSDRVIAVLFMGIANGATIITGVEVGYSSINIPFHKGKAIKLSMKLLFGIVSVIYLLQIANFLTMGIAYDPTVPVPIQIAKHLGGDYLALPFGLLTALILILASQTAQTDYPLELLRASRSKFFPRGLGDMAWKRTTTLFAFSGHNGVYNPRATILLGVLTVFILWMFPTSHHIEGMYGLAVVMAMNITVFSFFVRQIRARRMSLVTVISMIVLPIMLVNIVINKFVEGAWLAVVLILTYYPIFKFSEYLYRRWEEKLSLVPLELGLWYPAFNGLKVDPKHIVLVSKFHPGVVHFLKNYVKSGKIPLVLHFHTDPDSKIPKQRPKWFKVIKVDPDTDTITAISKYVREHRPERVHLIPLLVEGPIFVINQYFGNSIQRLILALSKTTDLQVEYNKERITFKRREVLMGLVPFHD